jgi:ribonuclease Z
MSELCFLGTGGSIPRKKRNNASLVFNIKNDLVLVDCPGDAFNKIKMLGFDPRKIRSIFITHTHPDHIYGLPSLIHSLMLDEMSLSLYGSDETVQFCKKLLDLFDLRSRKVKCRIKFRKLEPDMSFCLHPSVHSLTVKTPHASSSLGIHFDFENGAVRLLYSGDTPVFEPLFKNTGIPDILIHDCSAPSRFFKQYPSLSKMHTSSLDMGKMAHRAGVRCLIPIHFFGGLDYSMDEIEKEIRKNYRNRLIIPNDLDKIQIAKSLLQQDGLI